MKLTDIKANAINQGKATQDLMEYASEYGIMVLVIQDNDIIKYMNKDQRERAELEDVDAMREVLATMFEQEYEGWVKKVIESHFKFLDNGGSVLEPVEETEEGTEDGATDEPQANEAEEEPKVKPSKGKKKKQ